MSKGFADYTPLTASRSLEEAGRCSKLGAFLTADEVQQYQMALRLGGIPCRTCEKDVTPARRCTDELQGPFTYSGKCARCPRFVLQAVTQVASEAESVG